MLLTVGPASFSVIKVTVYVPSSVMVKLQLVSDGVRSEHLSADIGAGPTATVTFSIGGVYADDDSLPYWMERCAQVNCNKLNIQCTVHVVVMNVCVSVNSVSNCLGVSVNFV